MTRNGSWYEVPLEQLAPACSSEMPASDETVWNLSLEDIAPNTGEILKRQLCRVSELGSSKCSFDSRHVLYCKLRPYLNKVVLPDTLGVGTSELIPLLPDPARVLREFLAFYLRSPMFVQHATDNSRGANLPRISMRAFWNHRVSIPRDLNEQRRIVEKIISCLDRIDESQRIVRRTSDQLDELKRVLVLGQSALDRTWRPVGEVVDWIQDSEPVKGGRKYTFAGIKSFGKGLFEREVRTNEDFAYSTLRRLQEGDFIYPKLMAWEGAFAMVTSQFQDYVVSPEFVVFRPKQDIVCCEVLDAYFRSPVCLEAVRGASTGSNRRRRRLNPRAFLNLKVPIPDVCVQKKLKAVYQYESQSLQEICKREQKLKALRETILRKAFAGEL